MNIRCLLVIFREHEFRYHVQEIIQEQMPEAEFIVVPSSYTEKGQYDQEIASAKGLYINMLKHVMLFTSLSLGLPKIEKFYDIFNNIQRNKLFKFM